MYAPRVIGGNPLKLKHFRIQEEVAVGQAARYPIGRYPFQVDIGFGSLSPTRQRALRINNAQAVKNSSNKLETKRLWGTEVPHMEYKPITAFITNRQFNVENFESQIGYPSVAKKINGSKGEGFTYIKDYNDLYVFLTQNTSLRNYFFEKMFDFNEEYRIHVSPHLKDKLVSYRYQSGNDTVTIARRDGVIFMLQKKLKREAYERGVRHTNRAGKYDDVIFTSKFTHRSWMDNAIRDAIKAIELLGLDFGFVDVGYNTGTQKYTFFESGSNPELTAPEIECYKIALPSIILYKGADRIPTHITSQIRQATIDVSVNYSS